MAFPNPPEKIVPFNSGPVAAHDIGRQFDEHSRATARIIDFLKTIFRSDGVVKETAMPAPPARTASGRGGSTAPALPTGVLGPDAGRFFATDEQSAGPLAQDYAQVSIDWAEHMPDTIPNQTMAVMAITGQHWSSRWWANQAALSVAQAGNYLPLAGGTMTGPLVIPVVADLSVGGGGTGQVLTAKDGSGALSWTTPSGVFIDAPSNSQYYSRYNGAWVVSPGGLVDAPNDGTAYARKSQAWSHLTHADITDWSAAVPAASTVTPIMDGTAAVGVGTTWARADHVHPSDASRLALSGGTLTGPLTLSGPPSNPLNAATKAYVDSGAFLPIAGGTVTGALNVAGTANLGNGNLIVTTTGAALVSALSVGPGLTVEASAATPSPIAALLNQAGASVSTWYYNPSIPAVFLTYGASYVEFDNPGNFIISSATAYKPGGGSWTAPSDARIKTVEGDYAPGLAEVIGLRPVTFTYRGNDTPTSDVNAAIHSDPDHETASATEAPYPASPHYRVAVEGRKFVGLVAQEVEAILPGLVTSREGFIDGEPVADLRDVDTTALIFALVNAVKTLAARIETLEAA